VVDAALPLVVKVGGSLAETGRLKQVLPILAASRRPIVIVPGGGAFADKVRDLQNAIRFDDASAHRLAMLGMHQMAEIYFTMQERLAPADSLEGFARVAAAGLVPVWLPLQMCQHDGDIPQDWTITSDGLAARLAERLSGAPLVLLKSLPVDGAATAEDLARDGIIDKAFPAIAKRSGIRWRILGPADDAVLRELVDAPVTALN
jgi:aspartokinase-like uncharacterized kinase